MKEEVRKILVEKSEEAYRDFSASLIPKSMPILGVRLPELRKIAKAVVKTTDWRQEITSYEGEYKDIYFEETMLRGMIIGYGTQKAKDETPLELLRDFIPHVDNWSVCDSFCNGFLYASRNRDTVWDFLQEYLYSDKEFEVRVAIILLLTQFLKYDQNGKKMARKRVITMEDVERNNEKENRQNYPYLERILAALNRSFEQGYYAQMAAAWTAAEAFVAFPYETMQMLQNDCQMDAWTYNKTLQKICESRNPNTDVKKCVKAMKW